MTTHVLFESATGYAVFAVKFHEEIGQFTRQVQDALTDITKFGQMVTLKTFAPYRDAAHALENANDVSEGVLNPFLASTLEQALPAKKKGVVLGISERGLAGSVKAALGVECDTSDRTLEIIRGIRLHAEKLLKGLQTGDVIRAQLGLGHAYSRAKVKFNVNRSDNMIIQSIALLDQLDKDVNLFAMRVREWYGWHFPELVRIVPDNHQYALCVQALGDKSKLATGAVSEHADVIGALTDALDGDESRARNIVDAARASMGTDISPIDLINISNFAGRVIHLFAYRTSLQNYLAEKMTLVAPNLGALIGNTVGARLISHAGSLTNLSKYPASTVQILGAEKALFRALKTKGNTPKYGLIYHSSFIGRAGSKNKGRISRFLANKCSIASRIDCFSDTPTTKFGEALRDQVEERLAFYETGASPTKNSEAMAKVLAALRGDDDDGAVEKPKKKKRKSEVVEAEGASEKTKKKKHRLSEPEAPAVSDTPAAPLSAMPPSEPLDLDDEAARKAAKKAKKAAKAAAAAAIVTPTTAEATLATSTSKATIEGETKKEKKKKRKSEGGS